MPDFPVFFEGLLRRKFVRDNLFLLLASVLSMFLGYVFQVTMARMLGPVDFGSLGVCIGVLMVLTVVVATVQTMVSKNVSELIAKKKEGLVPQFVGRFGRRVVAAGLVVGLLVFLLSGFLADLFNDPSLSGFFALVALLPVFAYLSYVVFGFLQGEKRFFLFGAGLDLLVLVKLLSAVALVSLGLGVGGALLGFFFGYLVVLFLAPRVLLFLTSASPDVRIGSRENMEYLFFVSLSTVFVSLFMYFDLFFVKSLVGGALVGAYNVGSLVARIPYFLVGPVVWNVFPRVSGDKFLGKAKVRESVGKALLMFVCFSVPVFLFLFVFSEFVVSFFFSSEYLAGVGVLRFLSLAYLLFGFSSLFFNVLWAMGKTKEPAVALFACLALDVLLLNFLVPVSGLEGAYLSCLASMGVLAATMGFLLSRELGFFS